jgi:hypothetical protein
MGQAIGVSQTYLTYTAGQLSVNGNPDTSGQLGFKTFVLE